MLIEYKENTKTRRFASKLERPKRADRRVKSLTSILPKKSGRLSGRVTVRHQGGRHKRFYREIDFKRDKIGVRGDVIALEYDPNRNVNIAKVKYEDGEFRYILASKGLKVGSTVLSASSGDLNEGNAFPLKNIAIGTAVHNVELTPGKGGQLARSAGTSVVLRAKDGAVAHLKLPSGEVRIVPLASRATVGVLGNEEWKHMVLGKAGRSRHMGIRPSVRGTAMDPDSHPHGGGEGRSGVGRKKPMTYYGRPAVGNTRKKNKWSDKYILKRRK